MVKGTVEAADGEATEALGLGGEGAESCVDVGVRKRKHGGIGGGWVRIVFIGRRNRVGRNGVTVFAMPVSMGVTHLWVLDVSSYDIFSSVG